LKQTWWNPNSQRFAAAVVWFVAYSH
jgi:hypothetical protein